MGEALIISYMTSQMDFILLLPETNRIRSRTLTLVYLGKNSLCVLSFSLKPQMLSKTLFMMGDSLCVSINRLNHPVHLCFLCYGSA